MNKDLIKHLGYLNSELKAKGGICTASEINNQPKTWKKTFDLFFKEAKEFKKTFFSAIKDVDEVIFTGAGTSSFIGESLSGTFFKQYDVKCSSIATTDIVSFPKNYFNSSRSYMLISFARSGDSPESLATVKIADMVCKKCYHLIITCNGEGILANYKSNNPVKIITLPPETNDKGLAMTSSYTSMLLTGLCLNSVLDPNTIHAEQQLKYSINSAKKVFSQELDKMKEIAQQKFERAIFLGSGPLNGTAMEAALKLQELTNGKIICKSDSFLGFRHGPKAVVDEKTMIVYFFNNNIYARRYEIDLLNSMRETTSPLLQLGIGENISDITALDYKIDLYNSEETIQEAFQPLSYILPAQLLGFFKSLFFGLTPDNPSTSGAISRVVQGVHIYPINETINTI